MIYKKINELISSGKEFYIITVVAKTGHAPSQPSGKMVVLEDGTIFGSVGGGALENLAVKKAVSFLLSKDRERKSLLMYYNLDSENLSINIADAPKGAIEVNTAMICGGTITLFFEYVNTVPSIVLMGGGHIGKALYYYLKPIGFNITIVDSRDEIISFYDKDTNTICSNYEKVMDDFPEISNASYYIIAAHSHELDAICLREILLKSKSPEYIAMVASSNKAKIIKENINKYCIENNIPIPDMKNLYSPAGLNIGGRTPEEIAVSIIAQLQTVRYSVNQLMHKQDEKK